MAMTSIYYTECGHWGRRNLSGSSRSRERYVESLGEGELYPDYKREALLKKREAEQISAAIVKRDAWIMDAVECLVRQFRR